MALTKAGDQCLGRAVKDSDYCPSHGGARKPVGRPTKLTEAVERAIVDALEKGHPLETAARAVGVDPSTERHWRERGEADLEAGEATAFARYAAASTRAMALGEQTLVNIVAAHAITDWRAAAFLLERRFGARFGKRVELAGEVNVPAPTIAVPESEEVRAGIADVLARAGAVAPAPKPKRRRSPA